MNHDQCLKMLQLVSEAINSDPAVLAFTEELLQQRIHPLIEISLSTVEVVAPVQIAPKVDPAVYDRAFMRDLHISEG